MKKKGAWRMVQALGTFALILAIINSVSEHFFNLSKHPNSGSDFADAALALLGVVSTVIADCLRKLEARVEELESRSSSMVPPTT